VAPEGLKTTQGTDDKIQCVHDPEEGEHRNRVIDVDDVRSTVHTGSGSLPVREAFTTNDLRHPEYFICLGAEIISGPITSDHVDLSR
jgi:hypothetical protein